MYAINEHTHNKYTFSYVHIFIQKLNMKKYSLVFAIITLLVSGCIRHTTLPASDQINSILGNISYEKKFGRLPDKNTDEAARIQTHLEYVEQLLRNKDISNMPIATLQKRNYLIRLLHEYRLAAKFPANYDYPGERKPCFIDKNGNICAVGYLVEKTAGRSLAEQINSKHQYDKIADMNMPELTAWVDNSGLTKEECEIIQPQYGPPNGYSVQNYVSHGNGITTAAWSGLNAALSINEIMTFNTGTPKTTAIAGMISGAGQIIFGVLTLPKDRHYYGETITNNAQKNVSFLNIGIGAATMFLSGWNHFSKKHHNNKNGYGFYGFPTPGNQAGIAFVYSRKL